MCNLFRIRDTIHVILQIPSCIRCTASFFFPPENPPSLASVSSFFLTPSLSTRQSSGPPTAIGPLPLPLPLPDHRGRRRGSRSRCSAGCATRRRATASAAPRSPTSSSRSAPPRLLFALCVRPVPSPPTVSRLPSPARPQTSRSLKANPPVADVPTLGRGGVRNRKPPAARRRRRPAGRANVAKRCGDITVVSPYAHCGPDACGDISGCMLISVPWGKAEGQGTGGGCPNPIG